MFSYITNKINKNVCLVVSIVLLVYFIVIFCVYSLFLRKDFQEKSEHIGYKIAQQLSSHCEMIEETVKSSIFTSTPSEINYSEIRTLLRTCISSNININNAFFYNSTNDYFGTTINQKKLQEYIESSRNSSEAIKDNQWVIFTPSDGSSAMLLYSSKIMSGDTYLGQLVINTDIDVYLRNADIYNSSFLQDASIFIGSTKQKYLEIYSPQSSSRNFIFHVSDSKKKQNGSLTYDYSINDELYMQIQFSTKNIAKNSIPMLYFLCTLFLISLCLCYYGIRNYTKKMDASLTQLTKRLDVLSAAEKESRKENIDL